MFLLGFMVIIMILISLTSRNTPECDVTRILAKLNNDSLFALKFNVVLTLIFFFFTHHIRSLRLIFFCLRIS